MMDDKDLAGLGKEIGETINKFVNSKEIKELQENIRKTVEGTVDEVRRTAQDAVDQVNKSGAYHIHISSGHDGKRVEKRSIYTGRPGAGGNAGNGGQPGMPGMPGGRVNMNRANTQLVWQGGRQLPVVRKPQGQVSGVLMEVLGICGATVGWTTAFMGYAFTMISLDWFGIGMGAMATSIAAVIAAACTAMAVVGGVWRRRAGRFKKYLKTMGNKDFYSISGLAEVVQKKPSYVIRDLKRMIRSGWFKEGHLDTQETCFMLTNESYQLYLDAQTQLRQRKEAEERRAREQELLEHDPAQKQLRMTIEEGKEYIRRIREINDDIPGVEISNKLYRLEEICKKIFIHVEKNPDKLADIRKFMNYYLPTTLKLMEQYRKFDMESVVGDNIAASKKEIEGALDDINTAFEKMFDNLFADEAMDVSTDISVLSTMLAQEGLLKDEFTMK